MPTQTFAQQCFHATVAERPSEDGLFLGLSPMDGITDAAFRELITAVPATGEGRARYVGSAVSMCVTEFFRVTEAPTSEEQIVDEYPEVRRGGRTTSGVLVLPQVMGSEPALVAETAARLIALGAPGVDLNFGCPVKAVNLKQAGAALLKEPERIEAICIAVRRAIGTKGSLSVKTRLGWDDEDDGLAELAKRIEGAGVDWLTIHGRTRRDGYRGEADWHSIGLAQQAVSIPVVANGDLTRMAQLKACAEQSGCRAFMVGRGVLGRPGLFHQLRGGRAPGDEPELLAETLQMYAEALLQRGMRERGVINRVRHWLRLIPIRGPVVSSWIGELSPRSGAEELLEVLAASMPAQAMENGFMESFGSRPR